jgi:hypothetical protein
MLRVCNPDLQDVAAEEGKGICELFFTFCELLSLYRSTIVEYYCDHLITFSLSLQFTIFKSMVP